MILHAFLYTTIMFTEVTSHKLRNSILSIKNGNDNVPVAAGQGRQIRQCRPRNLFEKNTI
jgi:hypothetical protein